MTAAARSTESDGQAASGARGGITPATALTVIGICCVVLGGLVAAVTEPLRLDHGSWLAAYLVLVGGVTQCAMGRARTWCLDPMHPRRRDWAQIATWNLGNVLVVVGTLVGEPRWVDLASIPLIIALAIALHAARPGAKRLPPLAGWSYRLLLLALAASIPVGMVLSHLRHS